MADLNLSEENKKLFDELLESTDLDGLKGDDNQGYENLKPGHYLCKLENASIETSKNNGTIQAKLVFRTIDNGVNLTVGNVGETIHNLIQGTENRLLYVYYSLKDEKGYRRFVNDLLKFEKDVGIPALSTDNLKTTDDLLDSLDTLIGADIFIEVTQREYNDELRTYYAITSWKRAEEYGLLEEEEDE